MITRCHRACFLRLCATIYKAIITVENRMDVQASDLDNSIILFGNKQQHILSTKTLSVTFQHNATYCIYFIDE